MTSPPRPMSMGEILDRAFQIYRMHFVQLTLIAVWPGMLYGVVRLADFYWIHFGSLVQPDVGRGVVFWRLLVYLAYYHVDSLIGLFFMSAFVRQVASVIRRQSCNWTSSLRFLLDRLKTLLWVVLLKITAVLVVPECLAAGLGLGVLALMDYAGMLTDPDTQLPWFVIAFSVALGLFLFAWLGACFAFAFPVVVLEALSGVRAMRRSWQLSKGSRARIFSCWLFLAMIGFVLGSGTQAVYRFVAIVLYRNHYWNPVFQRLYSPGSVLIGTCVNVLLIPLYPITLTLLYYDQRIRREGLDIEWLMNAAGWESHANPPAVPTPVATATGEPLA